MNGKEVNHGKHPRSELAPAKAGVEDDDKRSGSPIRSGMTVREWVPRQAGNDIVV